MYKAVQVKTKEEWDFVTHKMEYKWSIDSAWKNYKDRSCINLERRGFANIEFYTSEAYKIYTFDEWKEINGYLNKKEVTSSSMEKMMLNVLNKTYDNLILRRKTVPLFMSNPGIGKTTIIKKFVEMKGVKMVKITLSQRMPNEVVGMVMPDVTSKSLVVYDSHELEKLEDGDVLFFDEVFNGTLKQTLDAVLNLLEDRVLPSGKKLADVLIVAASNPQGLINITPQIKERFIRYDLKFDSSEYQALLQHKYGMPPSISNHLCTLINKEKFEQGSWDYVTPRSIEKAINQIGCELESAYDNLILPFLNREIELPTDVEALKAKKGENIKYLSILKLLVENDNKNCK